MKKIFTLVLVALMSSMAWGETVVLDFAANNIEGLIIPKRDNAKVYISTPVTVEGVTLQSSDDNSYLIYDDEGDAYFYLRGTSTLTVSVADGYKIKQIEMVRTTVNYANRIETNVGTYTEPNSRNGLWEGDEQSVVFSIKSSVTSKNVMIDKLTVTYEQDVATAISDLDAQPAVKAVHYYNLQGMQSATPFDGVNIVVTEMADGSKSTTKVIK
ncbi:MAG: hypothetical protein J6I72_02075 [Muribaculaceae bacterium]|nr:hypothetical protein [Muribaculaceae bacterium]